MVELDRTTADYIAATHNQPITEVHIDQLTVLNVVNHCNEKLNSSNPVSGLLLGINMDNVLQVSNSLPHASRADLQTEETEEFLSDDAERRFEVEMLRRMTAANADNNVVGWYQSTVMEQYNNVLGTIDNQYKHQLEFGQRCVCLVYDPIRSRHGHVELRAIRLTEKFMDLVRKSHMEMIEQRLKSSDLNADEKRELSDLVELHKLDPNAVLPHSFDEVHITQSMLSGLNMRNEEIFEELPIKIKNRTLAEAYLANLATSEHNDDDLAFYDSLDLSCTTAMERELDGLYDSMDSYVQELKDFANYQRRLAKRQGQRDGEEEQQQQQRHQPNRLDSIMYVNQINNYVKRLNQLAIDTINNNVLAKNIATGAQQSD